MKICFECGESASIEHHVIPSSMGGEKTVPLCMNCHKRVHGVKSTERQDSASELTKRGIDKHRLWQVFAVYLATNLYGAETVKEIVEVIKQELDLEIAGCSVQTTQRRIKETSPGHLSSRLYAEFGEDLSYIWDEERAAVRSYIANEVIAEHIQRSQIREFNLSVEELEKLTLEIEKRFLKSFEKPESNQEQFL